jgi:uncharacterized membrane protein YfcA
MIILLYVAIGLVSGSLLGFIGTGAGLVIIPALVIFAHFHEKVAIGTSLTLLLPPVGLLAVATYWKHGDVNITAAAVIMVSFVISSYFASRLAINLPDSLLERCFGVVAIAIGIRMLVSA